MMAKPTMLLLDESSMGLAPQTSVGSTAEWPAAEALIAAG
jgi:hypothetical protein